MLPKDITLIIKTFNRPYCLVNLLRSCCRMGWACPILIADDSQVPYKTRIEAEFGNLVTDYICLPFDVGLSAGRNALLSRVETPYFVLCDDDFIFDKRADLAFMRHILATTDVELLGGLIFNRVPRVEGKSVWQFLWRGQVLAFLYVLMKYERIGRFQGNYELTNRILYSKAITYNPPFTPCDYVQNFFMAKTAAFHVRSISWDDSLKVGEHEAFFWEAKQKGLRIATTEEVGVVHQPVVSEKYNQHRDRLEIYRKSFMRKHGLTRFVDTVRGIETVL